MYLISLYLVILNALGFILMHIDKGRARKNLWRIPEATLLTVAALGGSLGSLLGMKTAKHKTMHPKFFIGIPCMFAIHIVIIILLFPIIS